MFAFDALSERTTWQQAIEQSLAVAEKCADVTERIRESTRSLPTEGVLDLWCSPDGQRVLLNAGDWIDGTVREAWKSAVESAGAEFDWVDETGRTYGPRRGYPIKIAGASPFVSGLVNRGHKGSPTLQFLAKATGYRPGIIPGSPNLLTAALASGLLGGGLGYGAGWLAEQFMPQTWQKGRLRRTLAGLGGLAGLGLPAFIAATNVAGGRPWYSSEVLQPIPSPAGEVGSRLLGKPRFATFSQLESLGSQLAKPGPEKAASLTGFDEAGPTIDLADLNYTLWNDPRVAGRLPFSTIAATSGLTAGASALSGGSRWVSPMDVGRMAAGMGAGYVSGLVVGKLLGALTGMPAPAQERLKNVGMYAGLVQQFVPIAFPR